MKKFSLLIAIIAMISVPAFAQPSRTCTSELSASYGVATMYDYAYLFSGVFASAISCGTLTYDNYQGYGSIGVEYFRSIGQKGIIKVGAEAMVSAGSYKMYSDKGQTYEGKEDYTIFAAMPAVKVMWFQKAHVAMYSKGAAGIAYVPGFARESDGDEVESPFAFTAQVSPVGVEFGGARIRGFAEGGFGAQGTVIFGARFRF